MKILGAIAFVLLLLVTAFFFLPSPNNHYRVTVLNKSQIPANGVSLWEEQTGRSMSVGTILPGKSRIMPWHPHEEISTFLKITDLGGKPVSVGVIPYPEGECAEVSVTIQPNLEIKSEMKQVNDFWCWKWE